MLAETNMLNHMLCLGLLYLMCAGSDKAKISKRVARLLGPNVERAQHLAHHQNQSEQTAPNRNFTAGCQNPNFPANCWTTWLTWPVARLQKGLRHLTMMFVHACMSIGQYPESDAIHQQAQGQHLHCHQAAGI